jgi:hypothetical protein
MFLEAAQLVVISVSLCVPQGGVVAFWSVYVLGSVFGACASYNNGSATLLHLWQKWHAQKQLSVMRG